MHFIEGSSTKKPVISDWHSLLTGSSTTMLKLSTCCLFSLSLVLISVKMTSHPVQAFTKSATINDVNILVKTLMSDYNKDTLPANDLLVPFQVHIQSLLLALEDLEEVEEKLTSVIAFYYRWTDNSITWDRFDHHDITNLTMNSDLMWKPGLNVINLHHSRYALSALKHENKVTYFENGTAFWSQLHMLQTTCNLDTTFYPFDVQKCDILFNIADYPAIFIEIISEENGNHLNYFSDNGMWHLVNYSVNGSRNSSLTIKYVLQRKPLFILINVMFPICVLTLLAPMVFVLPRVSGERVGYSVTILLAISVYMMILNDNLPPNSSPMPIVSVFLFIWYMLTTSIVCMAIVNNRMFNDESRKEVPHNCKRLVLIVRHWMNRICCAGNQRPEVDKLCDTDEERKSLDVKTEESAKSEDISWSNVSNCVDLICVVCLYTIEVTFCLVFFLILSLHRADTEV